MQGNAPQPPKLLDQLRDKVRLKHYSLSTERQYAHWVKRFVLFHGKRHPKDMGAVEVEVFLTHLTCLPIRAAARSAAATSTKRACSVP